ncbi:hypothetical protein [Rhodanobacter lindaniclasticus]
MRRVAARSISASRSPIARAATIAQTLTIDSPLSGTALALPAPLDKPAASSLPLHLEMSLPTAGSNLQLELGQLLRGHMRLPDDAAGRPFAGTLAFGTLMPQVLPDHGMRIRGHAARMEDPPDGSSAR